MNKLEKIKKKVLEELKESPLSCIPNIQDMELPQLVEHIIKLTAKEIFEDIEKHLKNQHRIYNPETKKYYHVKFRFPINKLKKEWGVDE